MKKDPGNLITGSFIDEPYISKTILTFDIGATTKDLAKVISKAKIKAEVVCNFGYHGFKCPFL